MNKLRHVNVIDVANHGVFDGVNDFDKMNAEIFAYGCDAGPPGSEAYNDRVGHAYEVYAEFWWTRYGSHANPMLGVHSVMHTSDDKYCPGYDFSAKDMKGDEAHIQVKWRSSGDGFTGFKMHDLGTFCFKTLDTAPDRRIWFSNIREDKVFHFSCEDVDKKMRNFGRETQEGFILRDPTFWNDFRDSIESSSQKLAIGHAPAMWQHQNDMHVACDRVMDTTRVDHTQRGRIICATGGGKTRVEYQVLHDGFFKYGCTLQVIVAPKIDLLIQHHRSFADYGMFERDGVKVIHFRTGSDARGDAEGYLKTLTYTQTTNSAELEKFLNDNAGSNILIFVTYASEENLFNVCKQKNINIDTIVWDEFHWNVSQKEAQREHLLTLPARRNIFFSASQKRGRIVSSTDESLFGPLLHEVTFSYLRKQGILVPKVIIKALRVNPQGKRMVALGNHFKKSCESQGVDAKELTREAVMTKVAHDDAIRTLGWCSLITFGSQVKICNMIEDDDEFRKLVPGCDVNVVHAGVPGRSRKEIYEVIATSRDSILLQHSIVKEGIDITSFNSLAIYRNMDVIGVQQSLGRIVRADKRDTEALKSGKISLDDPAGWHKYSAVVYVEVPDGDEEALKLIQEIIEKLIQAGLTEDDFEFQDVVEERVSSDVELGQWIVPWKSDPKFSATVLNDYVSKTMIEEREVERSEKAQEMLSTLSFLERFRAVCE